MNTTIKQNVVHPQVYLSHHNQRVKNMACPSNMVQKVDIKEVVEDGVIFQDGSYEKTDSILYCTGMYMIGMTHVPTHYVLQ